MATVPLFSKGQINPFLLDLEADMLVGHIQCKKDTHKVVASAVAEPLNASLKACGEELVFPEKEGR